MKKASGIIAIIAGVFSIFATIATFLFGGLVVAFGAETGNNLAKIVFAGIGSSFLVIIFGAICLNAKSKAPGLFLTLSSIVGIMYGRAIVAIFMVLAFIAGIIALISTKKIKKLPTETETL